MTRQLHPVAQKLAPQAPAQDDAAARALDWDELRYFLAVVAAGSLSGPRARWR